MKRVTQGGDINFNVTSVRGLGDTYTIKFYTTDKSNHIFRVDGDVVDDVIRLEWPELEALGDGVLNYIAENVVPNTDYNDGLYNRTFGGTTQWYIVTSCSGGGGGSSEEISELSDRLDAEIQRSTDKDDELEAAIDRINEQNLPAITDDLMDITLNTYRKNETYSRDEVDELIEGIETGEINIDVVDNLNSENANKALSARQGNVLRSAIEQLRDAIAKIAYIGVKPEFSWEGEDPEPVVYHNVILSLTNLTCQGNTTVEDGQTWTGTLVADNGYDLPETLTSITGTYGSVTYQNGIITITNVTSDVVITASGVEQTTPVITHNVSWNLMHLSLIGNTTVEDGQTWTGTLVADNGYNLPDTLTSVTGSYGNITYSNGVITIANITSDIIITASGVEEIILPKHTVTKKLLNYVSEDSTDEVESDFGYLVNTVDEGSNYTTYITPANGSTPNNDVIVRMGRTDITSDVYDDSTGKVEISNVTDDIIITATASSGIVKVTATVEDGTDCNIVINGTTYNLVNGENTIPDSITNITSISLYNTTHASKYTAFDFGGAVMQNLSLTSKFRLANLTSVNGLVIKNPTSMQYMFFGCTKLSEIQTIGWSVANCPNKSGAFTNVKNITNIDLDYFVGAGTTNLVQMLSGCTKLTSIRGLNTWDMQNVTAITTLFNGCKIETLDISGWKTTSKMTTGMSNAFTGAKTLIIGDFDTSGVNTESTTDYISNSVNTVECTTMAPPSVYSSKIWLKLIYPLYHDGGVIQTGKIIVPTGARNNYISEDGWSEFADIIIEKQ